MQSCLSRGACPTMEYIAMKRPFKVAVAAFSASVRLVWGGFAIIKHKRKKCYHKTTLAFVLSFDFSLLFSSGSLARAPSPCVFYVQFSQSFSRFSSVPLPSLAQNSHTCGGVPCRDSHACLHLYLLTPSHSRPY